MRVTVLGGSGAWPTATQGCSGYLVEHDGFTLLVDPGYATMPRLQEYADVNQVDAVVISHGHPDHCADLNPLLRARALRDDPAPALPVYALPGATDAVLALDRPGMLSYLVRDVTDSAHIGPFSVETVALPHFVPNVGIRLTAGGRVVAYTGDTGPSPDVVHLGRNADVLLAEATYVDEVTGNAAAYLSSARQAGGYARDAGVGRLVLTHLWPGTPPAAVAGAAAASFTGPIDVASPGLVMGVG